SDWYPEPSPLVANRRAIEMDAKRFAGVPADEGVQFSETVRHRQVLLSYHVVVLLGGQVLQVISDENGQSSVLGGTATLSASQTQRPRRNSRRIPRADDDSRGTVARTRLSAGREWLA